MAQGGDPTGTGTGGPGYAIYDECKKPNFRRHFRGSVSMAKSPGPNTGGSQFFLTFLPTAHLNGEHTCFGRIVEGLDVLAKLQRVNPEDMAKPTPDKIIKAEVVRKRDHAYARGRSSEVAVGERRSAHQPGRGASASPGSGAAGELIDVVFADLRFDVRRVDLHSEVLVPDEVVPGLHFVDPCGAAGVVERRGC